MGPLHFHLFMTLKADAGSRCSSQSTGPLQFRLFMMLKVDSGSYTHYSSESMGDCQHYHKQSSPSHKHRDSQAKMTREADTVGGHLRYVNFNATTRSVSLYTEICVVVVVVILFVIFLGQSVNSSVENSGLLFH